MPTFIFLVDGKKVNEFSGASEGQLKSFTKNAVDKAERANVKLDLADLMDYYAQYDKDKDEAAIAVIHDKCAKMNGKKSVECVGGAATEFSRKLKKKYGKAPALAKRFVPLEGEKKSEKASSSKSSKKTKDAPKKQEKQEKEPLSLSTISKDDLVAELERRLEAEAEAAVESEEDDEAESANFYTPSDFPERIVIIGGGPAGMAAAIYAARAGLTPVIVAPPVGGQLQGKGVDVENYPGLANQTGPGVVSAMREQAISFGTTFHSELVTGIDVSKRPYVVRTGAGASIETHTIILATGAESNWLDVPGEYELRGGGVSSCATCDGFLYRDQHVVVVGGGDTAMEDALVLARTSKKVTVIHRRDSFRASKILSQRLSQHEGIEIIWNATVKEIHGKEFEAPASAGADGEVTDLDDAAATTLSSEAKKVVTGLTYKDVSTGAERMLDCTAVFVAIGHTPNTQILEGIVDFQSAHKGYVQVIAGSTRTSLPGIFAAGDVSDAVYRQAITSAGSGAQAALDAERWLSEEGLGNEAAEFEREMMLELLGESSEGSGDGGYNPYEDADVRASMKGMKDDTSAPVKEKKKKEDNKAGGNGSTEEGIDEHIEL
jgi:thioredoxin reductase (NADPH)